MSNTVLSDTEPETSQEIPKQARTDALTAYLMMFVILIIGLPFPFINLIASIIYCVLMRHKSKFVRYHSWQSLLSQILISIFNSVLVIWFVVRLLLFLFSVQDFFEKTMSSFSFSFSFPSQNVHKTRTLFSDSFGYYFLTVIAVNITYYTFSIIAAVKAYQGKLYHFWLFGTLARKIVYKESPPTETQP